MWTVARDALQSSQRPVPSSTKHGVVRRCGRRPWDLIMAVKVSGCKKECRSRGDIKLGGIRVLLVDKLGGGLIRKMYEKLEWVILGYCVRS